jgi:uncharacterized protein YdhG (YjbR/CyaY superfamily)
MKKVKARKRTAPKRLGKAPQTIDEYLARIPQPARGTLEKIRMAIRSAVPPETAEIISYGIPAFKHKQVLVWFAAFSDHCSLFPTAAVADEFKNELKGFATSKGTIHFPIDKALSKTLVKKLVKARLAQIERKYR